MRLIKSVEELEPGKWYFCRPIAYPNDKPTITVCSETEGRKYIGNRQWAMPDNNQVTNRFLIVGPIEFPADYIWEDREPTRQERSARIRKVMKDNNCKDARALGKYIQENETNYPMEAVFVASNYEMSLLLNDLTHACDELCEALSKEDSAEKYKVTYGEGINLDGN